MTLITVQAGTVEVDLTDLSLSNYVLRIYNRKTFIPSTGETVLRNPMRGPVCYREVPATYSNGVLSYDSFTIDSTEDALSDPDTTSYNIYLFADNGDRYVAPIYRRLRVPTDTPTTLSAIVQFSDDWTPGSGGDGSGYVHLNGYATLAEAVAGLGSTVTDLIVSRDIETDSVSIPSNLTLRVVDRAVITVNAGETLTIRSFVDPGNVQVFDGAGTVQFGHVSAVRDINVAWWCGGDSTLVNAAQFTAALDAALLAATNLAGVRVYIPSGDWSSNGGHEVYSSTTVFSAEGDRCIIRLKQDNTALFTVIPVGSPTTYTKDVQFRGVSLYGEGRAGSKGIYFDHASQSGVMLLVRLSAMRIQAFEIGVDLDGGGTNQFANVVIDPDVQLIGSDIEDHALVHIDSVNSNVRSSAMMTIGPRGVGYHIDTGGTVEISGAEVVGTGTSPGTRQEIKNTVVAPSGITGAGSVRLVVEGADVPNSPVTIDFNVTTGTHNTAAKIAQGAVQALGANPSIRAVFEIGLSGADIILRRLDPAANDPTLNLSIANNTASGVTSAPTATQVVAGAASSGDMSKAFIKVDGRLVALNVFSCQDEFIERTFHGTVFDPESRVVFDSCLIQGQIVCEAGRAVSLRNCYLTTPQLVRAPSDLTQQAQIRVVARDCYIRSSYVFNNGAGTGSLLLLTNFGLTSGGQPPATVDIDRGPDLPDGADTTAIHGYQPGVGGQRIVSNQPIDWRTNFAQSNPRAQWRFLRANSGDKAIAIGNCDQTTGEPTYLYELGRNTSTGRLEITSNQGVANSGLEMLDGFVSAALFDRNERVVLANNGSGNIDLSQGDLFYCVPTGDVTFATTNHNNYTFRRFYVLVDSTGTTSREVSFSGGAFFGDIAPLHTGPVDGVAYLITFVLLNDVCREVDRRVLNTPARLGSQHLSPYISDDSYDGTIIDNLETADGLSQWDAVYLNGSSEWALADANGSGTYPARGIAVEAASSGDPVKVLVNGLVRNDGWTWTPGGAIYLDTTAGSLTGSPPGSPGEAVQEVGYAVSADIAFFHFNGSYSVNS